MDPPEKPDDSDCCNSGCTPCILDIYNSQLETYENYKSGKITDFNISKTLLKNVISQTSYTKFKFISKTPMTTEVFLYTFSAEVSKTNASLQYKAGQHLILRGFLQKNSLTEAEVEYFTRPLTPIQIPLKFVKLLYANNLRNNGLHFQILVKILEDGKMSNYLQKLQLNDVTYWRGPYGSFDYNLFKKTNKFNHLICFAQGVGISPIFCIIDSILKDTDDFTRLQTICCFKNVENILLRTELFELKQYWNFKYNIYLSEENCKCSENCNCFKNKVKYSEPILNHRLTLEDIPDIINQSPIQDTLILICGGNKFTSEIRQFLLEEGVCENRIHVF